MLPSGNTSSNGLSAAQQQELAIFVRCLGLFEELGTRYFLLGGSALGAVRHRGFIPWDDDVDIGVPRPDYERLLGVLQERLGSSLFVQNAASDACFPFGFTKIRLVAGDHLQQGRAAPDYLVLDPNAQVDLFPLDGYPGPGLMRTATRLRVGVYNAAIHRRLGRRAGGRQGAIRRSLRAATARVMSALFELEALHTRARRAMLACDYDSAGYVINWYGAHGQKEAMPKSLFEAGAMAEFQGLQVEVPSETDAYLRRIYGDYMRLPPPAERRSPHDTSKDMFTDSHVRIEQMQR